MIWIRYLNGRFGKYYSGGNTMYHYVEDKQYLKKLKSTCSDIINQLVQAINNDDIMRVEAHLVGSGAKNLVTQNANEPVDLDYNLCIIECYEFSINDGRAIKEYIQNMFNVILNNNGWGDCKDSTSVLTTEFREYTHGNKTPFSIDLGIVIYNHGSWKRLIHRKTGNVRYDEYYWNDIPHSHGLDKRIEKIKANDLWLEVRKTYLEKKNLYLSRQDHNHPSFICYIESVNEVYSRNF